MIFVFDESIDRSPLGVVKSFIQKSERVINVTHKPRSLEFRQIAYITALGMLVIGSIGFVISMTSFFIRGS